MVASLDSSKQNDIQPSAIASFISSGVQPFNPGTVFMDAGGLNNIAAVYMWVNLQTRNSWNFMSFCQGVSIEGVRVASVKPLRHGLRLIETQPAAPCCGGLRAPLCILCSALQTGLPRGSP